MNILHSKIIGKGVPLLIVHGYFGAGDNWKSLGLKFSEHFEVHLIDQRNHGRSFHSDDFDYELMVSDLYNYIQHHQLAAVFLIGHSMGGKTAMFFAVEYPELVKKIVIVDISPKAYEPHHEEILEGLNAIDFSVQNTRKLVDEKLSAFVPETGIRQFLLKNVYWKEKGQLDFRFNLQSLTVHNDEVGEGLHSFTTFEGEALFLKGENSGYIPADGDPLIDAHFPNSKLIVIVNSGHWLHAENPTDFYNEVVVFLTA